MVTGNGNATDTECRVMLNPLDEELDFSTFQMIWRLQGSQIEGDIGEVFDCSVLPAGVHLISLEVINNELISAIEGINLVRLPGTDLTE